MNLRFIKRVLFVFLLLPISVVAEVNTPTITTLEFEGYTPFSNTINNSSPKLSADGKIVTFNSKSTYTNRAAPNLYNSYIVDRKNNSIKLASTPANIFPLTDKANDSSFGYEVSNDGNLIAVCSRASNLIQSDNNNQMDLFIFKHITEELYRVSVSNDGQESNSQSCNPSISANGHYVTFDSTADNLVDNDDNQHSDIFIHDTSTKTLTRIDTAIMSTGELTGQLGPSISGDGRFVTFIARPADIPKTKYRIYLYDRLINDIEQISISELDDGSASAHTSMPVISDNAKYIYYRIDYSPYDKFYIYNIETKETKLISKGFDGEPVNGYSASLYTTSDGRYATFISAASNLVENDSNNFRDVFLYDSKTDSIKKITAGFNGEETNNHTNYATISADGSTIAFQSQASNILSGDNNGVGDIFFTNNPFLVDTKEVNLSINKTVQNSSIEIGSNITYTLTIDNISADTEATATEVSATDTLPAGLTFVSATPSTGSCTEDSGTVTCNLGDIAVGDPSVTVDIIATATAAGEITNTASVSATETDLDISNNSSEVSVTVIELTDAYIDGSIDDTAAYYIGDKLTYSFEVGNNSSNPATDVTAEITLPTNLSISSVDTDTGTCSTAGQKVTCIVGDISSANANITVEATPSSAGNFDVVASVTTTKTDSNEDNNSDTVSVTVNPKSDIAVSLSDSSDPIYAGNNLTYTITVTNNGPSDASNIKVEDTLPTGVNFVSASAGCNESAGVVTCNIANLAIGSSSKVDVVIKPTTPGTITNKASVSADEFDDTEANNSASEDTIVNAVADLSITQTDEPDPVYSGSNVTYTLKVTNNGINTASNIKITDTLPAGVTFVSASSGCSESVGVVTCNVTNLAKDASTSVNVVVKTGVPGTITNKATVSATEYDPNTDNNSSEQSTEVKAVTDMEIVSASASPNPVYAGDDLTYTVKIKNNATQGNTAQEIKLTFTFNDNIVLDAASSCAATGNTVTCDIGPMTYNQEKDIQLVIQPNMDGDLGADINVSSTAHDPDTSNNDTSVTTTVEPAVDLTISMVEDLDPVLVKQDLTYTITVTNTGPSLAENVVLTDTLPGAAPVQSFTISKGTCVNNLTTLDCDLGDLADDESVTIDLVLQPTNGAVGALVNTATVSNDTYERPADPDNNTASVTTTVNQSSTVKVSLKGKGSGSVTGAGISCPGDCEETFNRGDTITLTAAPDAGSTFDRWQGGVCKGKSPTCTFTLDKPNMNVQASFK